MPSNASMSFITYILVDDASGGICIWIEFSCFLIDFIISLENWAIVGIWYNVDEIDPIRRSGCLLLLPDPLKYISWWYSSQIL